MNNKNLKYILYARKSSESEDRQMESIEDQIKVLMEIANRQGLTVVETIQEAKSAKKPGREGFGQVLEKINSGEADAILCWKLNRLSRNPIDGGSLSWMLQNSVMKAITTSERTHYPDENVILLAVEFGMANQFLKDLSKDTRRGLKAKAKRGWYPCSTPVGYKKHPDMKKGEKEIIVDEERFPAVRAFFDHVLSGQYGVRQALEKVTEDYGLRSVATKKKPSGKYSLSTAYSWLKNPFYYGRYEYPRGSGTWYDGAHKPMLTKREFDKLQQIVSLNYQPNCASKSEEFLYRGPLTCGECGCKISSERRLRITCDCKHRFSLKTRSDCPKCGLEYSEMKNPKLFERDIYHCSKKKNTKTYKCSQKSFTDKEIEVEVKDFLHKKLHISDSLLEWGLQTLKELDGEANKDFQSVEAGIKKKLTELDAREKSARDKMLDGVLEAEDYKQVKAELQIERDELSKALKSDESTTEKAEYYFNFAKDALEQFKNGSEIRKKRIYKALGSNHSVTDKKPCFTTPSPLEILIRVNTVVQAETTRFEPVKTLTTQRKNPLVGGSFPEMLRR